MMPINLDMLVLGGVLTAVLCVLHAEMASDYLRFSLGLF